MSSDFEKQYAVALGNLLKNTNPFVYDLLKKELNSQRESLKLIASENYSSIAVQAAMGTIFTDKYAEGIPYHRFYAGCENVDEVEKKCADTCAKLFGADFAYVQPHSGADANLCAYWAILNKRIEDPFLKSLDKKNTSGLSADEFEKLRELCHEQSILALDYYSGGHLTHGYRLNVSGQIFKVHTYSVDKDTYLLDYEKIEKKALEVKPLILLAGYSAYSRKIDFSRLKEIAKKCNSTLMVDMAHFSGLVAGGVFDGVYNPVRYADIVTSTTHKTLRGPRGGFILSTKEYAPFVEKGCPLVIGGPLEHVISAKLIAFEEASSEEFKAYARKIVENSNALSASLMERGIKVLTGGTDNHIVLVDVSELGINGKMAENALRSTNITLNRNAIPFDKNGPWYTSGLRLGTAALTTRGMREEDMTEIADIISDVLFSLSAKKTNDGSLTKTEYDYPLSVQDKCRQRVLNLLKKYPLYPQFA